MIAKPTWAADAMHSLQSTCHSTAFADDNAINVAVPSAGNRLHAILMQIAF